MVCFSSTLVVTSEYRSSVKSFETNDKTFSDPCLCPKRWYVQYMRYECFNILAPSSLVCVIS